MVSFLLKHFGHRLPHLQGINGEYLTDYQNMAILHYITNALRYANLWEGVGAGMDLSGDSLTPIYIKIAQWLEDGILDGSLSEGERVYSQYQLAEMFNINPATAAKGLSMLADDGIVYKKRGLGMFVSMNAKETIIGKRRGGAFEEMARQLVHEAKTLEIGEDDLIETIRKLYEKGAAE